MLGVGLDIGDAERAVAPGDDADVTADVPRDSECGHADATGGPVPGRRRLNRERPAGGSVIVSAVTGRDSGYGPPARSSSSACVTMPDSTASVAAAVTHRS